MTRLSSEALAAGWGASADLARLAQAKAENDALLARDASEAREKAFDTDAAMAGPVRDLAWLGLVLAALSIAGSIYGLTMLCGGL